MPVPNDTLIPNGFKRCKDCGEVKPLKKFHGSVHSNGKMYYLAICRLCRAKSRNKNTRLQFEVPEGYKRCTNGEKCLNPEGPVLPATTDFFYKKKTSKGKPTLTSQCRECSKRRSEIYNETHGEQVSERNRVYRQEHADEIREQKKEYHAKNREQENEKDRQYARNHPVEARERSKKYRNGHPERNRTRHKLYRATHTGQISQSSRKYRINNPEQGRRNTNQYRARKRDLLATFTKDDWRRALEYFHGTCAYCGNPPSMFDVYTVLHQEHYHPAASGGGYTPDNIVPACQHCNYGKGDSNPREWLIERFGKRKAKQIESRVQEYFEWVKSVAKQGETSEKEKS